MILAFGISGLKWKSKSSSERMPSKLARRMRDSSCLASRRSTSSDSSRKRNSPWPRSSSVACRVRSSSDCSTPDRRSFLSSGIRSSIELIVSLLLGHVVEQLAHRASEAR
jgi:hypothetical protein